MATTVFRVPTGANQDLTGRVITRSAAALTYAATIAVSVSQEQNLRSVALTGAATITIATVTPLIGDTLEFIFSADAGGARVVTFTTGTATSATLSVAASKFGYISFMFNGTVWQETGRALTV